MKQLLISWGNKAFTGIVFAVAAIVPIHLACHATPSDRGLDPVEPPGGGVIVRSELQHIWLPEALTELGRQQALDPVVRDHRGLKRLFELRDEQDLWYALTARCHQVNGHFVDITIIRRPYHDPRHFMEFLAVLATTVGDSPRDPDLDVSTASIHIIPEELAESEPQGVVAALLDHPSPSLLLDAREDSGRKSRSSPRP